MSEKIKNKSVTLKELVLSLICALVMWKVITNTIFFIGLVPSESMLHTLQVKDRLFITKNFSTIERGNIYTFNKEDTLMIKRCIAVGGDTVRIINNKVYVNGKVLDEPYVSSEWSVTKDIFVNVPLGSYYFLGDNRADSYDARYWKEPFVKEEDITGQAKYIIYPFNRQAKL